MRCFARMRMPEKVQPLTPVCQRFKSSSIAEHDTDRLLDVICSHRSFRDSEGITAKDERFCSWISLGYAEEPRSGTDFDPCC